MTRRDYVLIAQGFNRAMNEAKASGASQEVLGVRNAACRVATELAGTNPRFDRARFLTACGV